MNKKKERGEVLMIYLLDRATGRVVARYKGDYETFIRDTWGGWYPFVKDGVRCANNGIVHGCEDYSKIWSPVPRLATCSSAQ